MHGTNKVRNQEAPPAPGSLQVHEVFYTIQGEGPFVGHPAVFVRLSGCNLRCWFCDTQWADETDPYLMPSELIQKILSVIPDTCKLIVLTGGEPTRQDLKIFLEELWKVRPEMRIQIETAGTYWQDVFSSHRITIVVSPKTPKINQQIYENAEAFKYIIRADDLEVKDGLPVFSTQRKHQLGPVARPRSGAPVYLSPCDEEEEEQNKKNRETVALLSLRYGYIAGIQLHKVFGLS